MSGPDVPDVDDVSLDTLIDDYRRDATWTDDAWRAGGGTSVRDLREPPWDGRTGLGYGPRPKTDTAALEQRLRRTGSSGPGDDLAKSDTPSFYTARGGRTAYLGDALTTPDLEAFYVYFVGLLAGEQAAVQLINAGLWLPPVAWFIGTDPVVLDEGFTFDGGFDGRRLEAVSADALMTIARLRELRTLVEDYVTDVWAIDGDFAALMERLADHVKDRALISAGTSLVFALGLTALTMWLGGLGGGAALGAVFIGGASLAHGYLTTPPESDLDWGLFALSVVATLTGLAGATSARVQLLDRSPALSALITAVERGDTGAGLAKTLTAATNELRDATPAERALLQQALDAAPTGGNPTNRGAQDLVLQLLAFPNADYGTGSRPVISTEALGLDPGLVSPAAAAALPASPPRGVLSDVERHVTESGADWEIVYQWELDTQRGTWRAAPLALVKVR